MNSMIRLGKFNYVNVAPVYYGLLKNTPENIHIKIGTPSELNHALLAGEIDISCISTYTFIQNTEALHLVPRLGISAHNEVESVLLFSRQVAWCDLDAKTIAVTDHSASSIELLRILCERRYHIKPNFVVMRPNLDQMLKQCDAALLIGDIALEEKMSNNARPKQMRPAVFDLAKEWNLWTGLPFVFGVWAIRNEMVESVLNSNLISQLYNSLRQGVKHIDTIARESSLRTTIPVPVIAHYLRLFSYDLSSIDLAGLKKFGEMTKPDFSWGSRLQNGYGVNVIDEHMIRSS